jgi:hypothetical protein
MNRAWIPAGALAGVSVAGLIALGPLTSSLGTQVTFNPALAVTASSPTHQGSVPVSVDLGATGSTKTAVSAALNSKGGRQAPAATTSGDAGQVGYKRTASSSSTTAPATLRPTPSVTPTAPSAPPKKPVKRQDSIGADSGPNSTDGLAGGSSHTSTSTGAQSGTPAP